MIIIIKRDSEEQKGRRKDLRGCKVQLIVDLVVITCAKSTKSALHMAYIDYQKPFDRFPHSWLSETLELYRIEAQIRNFLKYAFTQWQTNLVLNTPRETINTGIINIHRGVYQGDALSALCGIWTILNFTRIPGAS